MEGLRRWSQKTLLHASTRSYGYNFSSRSYFAIIWPQKMQLSQCALEENLPENISLENRTISIIKTKHFCSRHFQLHVAQKLVLKKGASSIVSNTCCLQGLNCRTSLIVFQDFDAASRIHGKQGSSLLKKQILICSLLMISRWHHYSFIHNSTK